MTIELSEKFSKEIEKFFNWANEHYILENNVTGNIQVWNTKLLNNYEEPQRNKLEHLLKNLMKSFVFKQNGCVIDDVKLIVKNFKAKKPKHKKNSLIEVDINSKLDTTETFFLQEIDFSTNQLIDKLGNPLNTGTDTDKHRYEWKIKFDGEIFSIYDWIDENGDFEDYLHIRWCLGGISRSNIKGFLEFLHNKKPKKEEENIEKPKTEKKLNQIDKNDKNELFGNDSDSSIDINLDDLDDMDDTNLML
jgi:hypothetical protein